MKPELSLWIATVVVVFICSNVLGDRRAIPVQPVFIPDRFRPVPPYARLPTAKGGLCPQNEIEKANFRYWRYFNETKSCFKIDERGPCNRYMKFFRVGNSDFGDCDCRQDSRCGRPLLYWKKTNECFYVNTQGPCQDDYWIVYGLNKKPICQRNPCLAHEEASPSDHRGRQFWISLNGKCYKTRTYGYCPNPEDVLFYRDGEGYPTCVPQEKSHVCHTAVRISRPCWAGQKFDVLGNCRNTVGLWGNEDDH